MKIPIGGALLAGLIIGASGGGVSGREAIHGIDATYMDRAVKPGDDFFAYANGAWDRRTSIPADRASWGLDAELTEDAAGRTRTLLDELSSHRLKATDDQRKAGDYYAAYLDEAAIERRGVGALSPVLEEISRIDDRTALARVLGSMLRADVDPLNATNFHTDRLFGLFVAQDLNEPSHNTAYLLQGGLAMPDREYYLADAERMANLRTRYRGHVASVLRLAGVTDADARAERIIALETRIAQAHWAREDSEDVRKANNQWRRSDFDTKAPGLEWSAFFHAAGLDQQPAFIVWQAGAIVGESALTRSEPLDTWKEYLQYIVINHWSALLPRAFADERFQFFDKELSGVQQMPARWKRAVASVNDALGDAVGQLYVQRYFPPESKARVDAMVAGIKAAFAKRIDQLTWMSPATKKNAQEKLRTLIVGIGYPDRWRTYGDLQIARDDALGNAMRAEAYEYQRRVRELGGPIDRAEWWMTPQTVNAVNLPIQNALNFPAAILQPPYFDPQAPAADNFAAVGAVIGHEISHSFDDQGSQFDASGRLANWWTSDDLAHFEAAAGRLVDQYNAYKPLPDGSVNGRQTLSENIADLAGLAAAYDAYRLELRGATAPAKQGFTGDQQFFIAFAQSWREKYREPLLRKILLTDGHAPGHYRADTVRNLDAWYDAFQIKPGETLYLAPGDRVRMW